jgi:hypothetical protein
VLVEWEVGSWKGGRGRRVEYLSLAAILAGVVAGVGGNGLQALIRNLTGVRGVGRFDWWLILFVLILRTW